MRYYLYHTAVGITARQPNVHTISFRIAYFNSREGYQVYVKSDDVIQVFCINNPRGPSSSRSPSPLFVPHFRSYFVPLFYIKMYGSYWLRSLVLTLTYLHFVKAHMRMSSPPPIRSPEEGVDVDFDQTSPLGVYPCKGFHTLPGHSSVMNIAAGSTIPVTYFSWLPHVLM
jgi:hypothetical protein